MNESEVAYGQKMATAGGKSSVFLTIGIFHTVKKLFINFFSTRISLYFDQKFGGFVAVGIGPNIEIVVILSTKERSLAQNASFWLSCVKIDCVIWSVAEQFRGRNKTYIKLYIYTYTKNAHLFSPLLNIIIL